MQFYLFHRDRRQMFVDALFQLYSPLKINPLKKVPYKKHCLFLLFCANILYYQLTLGKYSVSTIYTKLMTIVLSILQIK